jgi:hypothetical protein
MSLRLALVLGAIALAPVGARAAKVQLQPDVHVEVVHRAEHSGPCGWDTPAGSGLESVGKHDFKRCVG